MAAAQAEITGRPGACLATLGPGAASLMNGIAHAWLDRVPLVVITDCQPDTSMLHQNLPHGRMFQPIVKCTLRPGLEESCAALERAIAMAQAFPPGPVHLDISGEVTSALAGESEPAAVPATPAAFPSTIPESRRPLLLVGLGARSPAMAAAVRRLCDRGIPALVTYKAKGVVPDRHPWFAGVLTNGALERPVLERADVFLTAGLDPVELLPRPWNFTQQQVAIPADFPGIHTEWDRAEVAALADAQRESMRPRCAGDGLLPHRVVEFAAEVYPGARIAVDAGAHMFPVMSLWPAEEPSGVLISNGLSTMGFALPTAIGAALLDRPKPVLAFTGDGGLLICLGELLTAARERLPIRLIVFDDGVLSLIRLKQIQRGYRTDGVSLGEIDWRSVAAGLGWAARVADSEEALRQALRETAAIAGPVLIDARINAEAYHDTIRALRG
jgi:acetolactate synthase-1/2/3 large subunit